MTRLSLRTRIFLFFCLLAIGGLMLAAGALGAGWLRADDAPRGPFMTAFIAFVFLNTGLVTAVWYLFDKNVAKPIDTLATSMRLRVHSGVTSEIDVQMSRYLGDLAPAARAVATTLSDKTVDAAAQVARETQRLERERARLTALLTEIPVATILLNPANEIVLYDGQAAGILSSVAPPRLKAPLSAYFDETAVLEAKAQLAETGSEVALHLTAKNGVQHFSARLKVLEANSFMLIIKTDDLPSDAFGPRPIVYDFDLLDAPAPAALFNTKLRDLCFVAFDTETTGLSTATDQVVQLAAVRVLNGRIVEGETLDCFVDPRRSIPAASTKIHGITDADVAGAPVFAEVSRMFHAFCPGAVIVAHNAPFDMAFLHRHAQQAGLTWDHPILDTVLLSAVVFGVTEVHSLDALCERLSIVIPPQQRHTALGDAHATACVLVKLIPLLQAKGLTTLGEVIAETAKHGRLLRDMNS